MALRMLLVGVVACLGLNPPTLRGHEGEPSPGAGLIPAGVGVLGALVAGSPIELPAPAEDVVVPGPAPAPGLAVAGWLLDWRPVVERRAATAVVEPRVFACTVEDAPQVEISAIAEVTEAEPTVIAATIEPVAEPAVAAAAAEPVADPDAGFRVALEGIVTSFEVDRIASLEPEIAPAPEAAVVLGLTEPAPLPAVEPEALYPGVAYELNRDNDGLDDPVASLVILTQGNDEQSASGEGRADRVAAAVRLTGQAIQAWGRIFVQTGPTRR